VESGGLSELELEYSEEAVVVTSSVDALVVVSSLRVALVESVEGVASIGSMSTELDGIEVVDGTSSPDVLVV
jgi:hypothetical protein